jgi:hypothetical protein
MLRALLIAAMVLSGAGLPAQIRFENIAAAFGVDFRLAHHPSPRKHLIETMPGGVAAFDFDGDGWTDIFFTNGAAIPSLEKGPGDSNRLFRNRGNGRFEDVTAGSGLAGAGYTMGVAAADFDNDGRVDLFTGGVRRNSLFRNLGGGRFADVTEKAGIASGGWSVGGGWFDFDNDGWLDLIVVNYLRWDPAMNRYCGDPKSGVRVYCHPRFFDGIPNRLYRNRGDGTFEDLTGPAGLLKYAAKSMAVAFGDYDRDGRTDFFLTSDTRPNLLFRNLGGGKFDEQGLLAGLAFNSDGRTVSAMGADFRDFDNDGWPDVHFTALSNESFPLFRNRGDGQFEDVTRSSGLWKATLPRAGWSSGFVDFDNDGWKDLFTANSHVNDAIERFEAVTYRQSNSVFRNLGHGRFEDTTAAAGPSFQSRAAHRGAAFADFDRDGRVDAVVTALGEPAEIWRNVTPRAGNWILVSLRGRHSNRDGIGATVGVGSRHSSMTSAVGYASSSHAGVHFGLGADERVDVVVRWPGGAVQRLNGVAANQVLHVSEPAPEAASKQSHP